MNLVPDLARIVPLNLMRLHLLAVLLGKPISQLSEFFLAHYRIEEFVTYVVALA